MNIQVYTAIMGAKDVPRNDIKVFSDADFGKFVSPVMNAKIFKVMPHKFFDCDISIWLDGNIFLKVPKEKLVEDFLGDNDIALFKHSHSRRLSYEVRWIRYALRMRPDKKKLMKEVYDQEGYYQSKGIVDNMKMAMGGMIIRRHTPLVAQFNETWWAEICRWSQRDQLSLPVVLNQFTELKKNYIPLNIKDNQYLRYETHAHFNT